MSIVRCIAPGDWRTYDGRYRLLRVQNELDRSNHYWLVREYRNGMTVENKAFRGSHHTRTLAKRALEQYLNSLTLSRHITDPLPNGFGPEED